MERRLAFWRDVGAVVLLKTGMRSGTPEILKPVNIGVAALIDTVMSELVCTLTKHQLGFSPNEVKKGRILDDCHVEVVPE